MQLFADARLKPMIDWFDAAVSARSASPGRIDRDEAVQGMLVLSRVLAREPEADQLAIKSAAIRDLKHLAKIGTIDAADIKTFRQAGPLFKGAASNLRGILTPLVLGEPVSSAYQSSMFADARSLAQMVQCLMHNFQPGQEQASLRALEQALALVARYGAPVHGPDVVNVRNALLTMHVFIRDRIETRGDQLRSLDDVMYEANRWTSSTPEGQRVARDKMEDALHHIGLALRGIEHTKISGEEAYALLKFLGDRIHGLDGDPRDSLTKLKDLAYSDCDFARGRRELRRDIRMVETDFAAKRALGGRLV